MEGRTEGGPCPRTDQGGKTAVGERSAEPCEKVSNRKGGSVDIGEMLGEGREVLALGEKSCAGGWWSLKGRELRSGVE